MSMAVASAYSTCEAITRTQARNFSYGIRLLPRERRAALSAVYALARRIDDIGDGDLPLADKRQQLAEVRASVARLADDGEDPVLAALADASRRFPIPISAFGELIDGVEMDLDARRYQTFDELTSYCRCVAGSIGRLCLAIFGSTEPERAAQHADQLGIALQQINILRDIREDLLSGRIYLPGDDLARFGVELRLDGDGRLADDGQLSALIRDAAARAAKWYDDGIRLVPLLDRRSAACTLAMAGIYRSLLTRIAADPTVVRGGRLSMSGWTKARVAGRALAGRSA
jgi:phytoene synthase